MCHGNVALEEGMSLFVICVAEGWGTFSVSLLACEYASGIFSQPSAESVSAGRYAHSGMKGDLSILTWQAGNNNDDTSMTSSMPRLNRWKVSRLKSTKKHP